MSLELLTNTLNALAKKPKSVRAVSYLAVDLYADYLANVTLAGGVVIDGVDCLLAFDAGLKQGFFEESCLAISPRWGVKKAGATHTAMYNLVDFTKSPTVTAGVLDVDASVHFPWESSLFNNAADTLSVANLNVCKNGKLGWISVSGDHGNATTGIFASFTPAAEAWNFDDYDARVRVNAVGKIDYDLVLPNKAANGVFIQQNGAGGGTMEIILNGIHNEKQSPVFTNLANNAIAPTFTLKAGATLPTYFCEWWQQNDPTRKGMINLSRFVKSRYP